MLEIILAVVLASMVVVNLFDVFNIVSRVAVHEHVLLDMQNKTQLINRFLRKKIHTAGDSACLNQLPEKKENKIQAFSAHDAFQEFGINAKAGSDVLLLRECVKVQKKTQYLPLFFYIAKKSGAFDLFYQMSNHPRLLFIQGMSRFKVSLHSGLSDVVIRYQLQSIQPVLPIKKYIVQQGVIYASSKITIAD